MHDITAHLATFGTAALYAALLVLQFVLEVAYGIWCLLRLLWPAAVYVFHHPGVLLAIPVIMFVDMLAGGGGSRGGSGGSSRSGSTSSSGVRRKSGGDSYDLDFDDYKAADPDYAIHGYRSGDKISDQISHDRWERCN